MIARSSFPDAGYDTTVCKVHSRTTNLYECRGARLPTEVEWEHAARAGTRTAFYGGDIATQTDTGCHPDPVADQIGWYCANSSDHLQEPGLKKPNAWGLYDMSGNAPEVVGEGWDTNWYRRMPSVDPWELDTPEFDLVVARGGSSVAAAFTLRSGSRLGNPSWSRVGLRLVRTIFPGDEARPKLATGSVDPSLFTDGGPK